MSHTLLHALLINWSVCTTLVLFLICFLVLFPLAHVLLVAFPISEWRPLLRNARKTWVCLHEAYNSGWTKSPTEYWINPLKLPHLRARERSYWYGNLMATWAFNKHDLATKTINLDEKKFRDNFFFKKKVDKN